MGRKKRIPNSKTVSTTTTTSSSRRGVPQHQQQPTPRLTTSSLTTEPILQQQHHQQLNKGTSSTTDWESLSEWSDASVAQVADWWNLPDKDVAKLWELRHRLQDVQHWQNQPNQVVRYYRDAHGNLNKAEQKFRRMIQWRIDEQVDAIVDDYEPPHPLLSEYLPTTVLDQYDRDGDPIWLERIGAADSWGLLRAFGQDELLRYAVWIRESCIQGRWAQEFQARNGGRPPMRATAIIDLEGMGWDHLQPSLLPLLKEGLVIVQHYYCGFGKKVIVIRTSKLFTIVWKVAKHFCGENLRNMMVFATADNYLQVLEEYIPLENLPPCLNPQNGKGRGGVGMPNSLEGGKVPSLEELDAIWAKRQEMGTAYNDNTDDKNCSIQASGTMSSMTSATTDDDSLHHTTRSLERTMTSNRSHEIQPEVWSEANFRRSMDLWKATAGEENQVRQLQKRLGDINHWKNSPADFIRYLRDCRHKVDQAEQRFRASIQWRLDHNVDRILETYRPPKLLLEYFSNTILRADCCDNDGDPIYVERPGVTDSWSLYQRFGRDSMLKYLTWIREEAARGAFRDSYVRQHGHQPMRITAVVDLQGMSARHMKPALLPLFRDVMRVAQDHYCGMAKRIFVIRAPTIFKVIWSIVHHFLDDKLKNMIVFASSSDYLEVLSEHMDLKVLPPCIYEQGNGEGGVGLPKRIVGGLVPPEHDHDLATPEDIDPQKDVATVSAVAKTLGGGSFAVTSAPDGDVTTVLTDSVSHDKKTEGIM